MPDTQYRPLGAEQAPAGWTLPAALEIVPKIAYASFDGSGAAGAFKPCLRLISDAGLIAGEYVTDDQVAAGGSADVSWFRGLKGKGAGASAGTDLSWCWVANTANIPQAPNFNATLSFAGATLTTNDPASFALQVHGGVTTLTYLAAGSYLAWGSINPDSNVVPPPAGSAAGIFISSTFNNEVAGNLFALFVNIGGGTWTCGVDSSTITEVTAPPTPIFVTVGQNTGLAAPSSNFLFAVKLSAATP